MHTKAQLRNRFLEYNAARINDFESTYSPKQARLIELLPVLIHTNQNLMPGYISKHTPAGIAAFTPSQQMLQDALRLNQNFSFDAGELAENPAIESLFIQQCILTGEVILWVIHHERLNEQQIDLLNRKTAAIVKWLAGFDVHMHFIVSNAASISYNYYSFKHYKFHIDKCFFLDSFYAESMLLGGKVPAWWLYTTDAEREQQEELVYCGDLVPPRPRDYMSAAIWHLYNIFQQPETSWINLAIIEQFVTRRMHQFFAVELREIVHNSEDLVDMNIYQGYSVYLKDTIDIKQASVDYSIVSHIASSGAGSRGIARQAAHKTVFDYLSPGKIPASINSHAGVDFRRYSQAIASLLKQSEQLFRRIKTFLNLTSSSCVQLCHELNAITSGLLSRLVETDRKISFINPSPVFALEKAHFRNTLSSQGNSWTLLADARDDSSAMHSSDNLIHLVCWAYLNRLIDGATQVSVQCADFSIRQIDIQNIIRTLQKSVHFSDFTDIDINHYMDEPRPIKSVLFIGHSSEYFREQTIDHLIIYNTGEIFIHAYKGLHVFYNWFESAAHQSVHACLYGSWANDYRNLNRKILSRINDISVN